ncbi:MocR-like pyridoxine biosynthesis transcription factor PdxR [Actinacidiphila acidipaludis]|uniref:PLP-dependent aminotransferase family protein n=1 Tax=Actinacidiphila acidipaludis TaxID=2873382 RepID=A0ABS7Q177_9ACTN|nr:PLP-dependent aminotransferase family protein [Streptomyces acidipaludis]MBY8876895.1 PLP-dependent aminotransferase family protein [Streptomyces acidipaludis]
MADSWPTSPGVDLHLDVSAPPGTGGRRAALERALRDAVRTGRLAPAARLPSTRRLAEQLGLSRGTVKAAYDQLIAEGYLTARQGSGTVVAERPGASSPAPPPSSTAAEAPRHDLRPGSPDVTSFPASAWLRATRRALAAAPSAAFDYGDPRGSVRLRTALAEYLGRARGVVAEPGRIVVTSGYVQGLALLVAVAGPVVAMEDPGLPFHREVVRRNGGRVVALPTDGLGARTDLLGTQVTADAVVVTPAHQYPTGVTLHPARRHALAAWARGGGGLVIEDDYDGEFRYDRQPVGALQGMAPDHVVYLGTASKTLGPALRLGWMVLPPRLVGPVTEAKLYSDIHTGAIGQLALAELIRDHGYDRHVRAGRLRYRRRRDLLASRLAGRYAPSGIAAGLQALVRLGPGGPDEAEVRARAARAGLAVGTLGDHWHEPGPGRPQGLIVGYGTPGEGGYPAAVNALVGVLGP